jgi:hypothetical protein
MACGAPSSLRRGSLNASGDDRDSCNLVGAIREAAGLPRPHSGSISLRCRTTMHVTNIDGRGLSLLFRQSKNVATISSSIVPVVQRIERWFPKPVMWVRFPPGTLGSTPLPSSAEFSGEPFSEKQKRSGHIHVAGAFAKGLPHLCRHGGCSVPPMVTGEKPGAGLGLPMKA